MSFLLVLKYFGFHSTKFMDETENHFAFKNKGARTLNPIPTPSGSLPE